MNDLKDFFVGAFAVIGVVMIVAVGGLICGAVASTWNMDKVPSFKCFNCNREVEERANCTKCHKDELLNKGWRRPMDN
jgi:hypothetical protein